MPGIPIAAAGSDRPAAIIICRDQLLYSFPLSTKFSAPKTIKLLLGLKDIAQALTDQHVSCARITCEEVPLKVVYVQLAEDVLYILCVPGSVSAPDSQLWGRLMAGVIVTAGHVQGCRLMENAGEGLNLLHRAVLRHVGHTPPPDSQVRQLHSAPEVQIHPDQAVAAVHSDTRSSCCLFFRGALMAAVQLPDIAIQQLWQLCWAMSMFDRGCQNPPLCKQQQVTWLPDMRHAELMIVGVGEVLMAAALPQDRAEGTGKLRDCLLATAEQLHIFLSSEAAEAAF